MESTRFTFGKHSGKTVAEVYNSDSSYIDWFLKQGAFKFKYRLIYQEITRLGANNFIPTNHAIIDSKEKKNVDGTEFNFGKHKGKTVADVYQNDKSYIDWLTKQPDFTTKHKNIQEAILYCQSNTIRVIENEQHINFHYGDVINFPESTIKIALQKLDIKQYQIKTNEEFLAFADNYNFDVFVNEDELKIALAWKYGICPDTFQSYFVNGIKNSGGRENVMNILIKQLTTKLKPEEKFHYLNIGIPIPRRICKALPFLFTPAFFQLRLLGLKNKEINKITNCQKDDVMRLTKIDFPDCIEQISPFYKFDWKAEFNAFLLNPYAYYTINLLTCDAVVRASDRNVNNMKYERELGMISRKIYENVKKNKWTCTPTWAIKSMNYQDHLEMLQNNYGLVFELDKNSSLFPSGPAKAGLDSVYLKHIQIEELEIAKFITDKMKTEGIDYQLLPNDKFQLSDEQLLAVKSAMSNPITVINALSGTGKTTIIKEIVRQITSDPNKVNKFVICSFTAKAVKRVQEVLGHHVIIKDKENNMTSCVRTIHSLMNAIKKEAIERPEYIIIDESTMVSLSLFAELVQLVHYMEFNLIMLGDINQLPPIKYGRPFEDMINSGQFETIKLSKNFRVKNGADDPIIVNSNNIINSTFFTVAPASNFMVLNSAENNFETDIKNLLRSKGITNQNAVHHKFITNTNDNNTRLNKIISDEIGDKNNKKAISCWIKEKKITMNYAVGDPVVFTKNHVYPGTFNGDQGVITSFLGKGYEEYMIVSLNQPKEVEEKLDEKGKKIDLNNIRVKLYPDRDFPGTYSVKSLLLAYSITVHKSQGSEYDNVYFYIKGMVSKSFNNKRLAYTAITRSKETCNIIEDDVGLFEACSRENISVHYGNLSHRVLSAIEGESQEKHEAEIQTVNDILALVNRLPAK